MGWTERQAAMLKEMGLRVEVNAMAHLLQHRSLALGPAHHAAADSATGASATSRRITAASSRRLCAVG